MLRKLIFPLLLLAVFSGCTQKEFDWVVKIEDQPITPEEYVSAQMQVYMEAQTLADDTDVLGGIIDGISGKQWIEENTINSLKRKVFVDSEFEKKNLKFADGADRFIKMFGEEGWDNVSRIYDNNGLDIDYYIEHLKSRYKEQLLFNAIFLSDNENAVTDKEIEDYLNSNLCRVSLFTVPKYNYDGTAVAEDVKESIISVINDSVDKINSGQSINIIATECLAQAGRLLGDPVDYTAGNDYVTTAFISNSGARLIHDFMQDFFDYPQGKCLYYELDDAFYICQKISLCDTQVEYMYMKQDVATHLRNVEFEEMVQQACADMDVELNNEAISVYTPAKIDMTID